MNCRVNSYDYYNVNNVIFFFKNICSISHKLHKLMQNSHKKINMIIFSNYLFNLFIMFIISTFQKMSSIMVTNVQMHLKQDFIEIKDPIKIQEDSI